MLRSCRIAMTFLNEVLSITAQECKQYRCVHEFLPILNEVLSITAQEWDAGSVNPSSDSPQ